MFITDYLSAVRRVYYSIHTPVIIKDDAYLSPDEVSYIEDYACGLFHKLSGVGLAEYEIPHDINRGISRIQSLRFIPEDIKKGLNKFRTQYNELNIKERDYELLMLNDSVCSLSDLALTEMYISDAMLIISSLTTYVRGTLRKTSDYDSILCRLDYCSASLSRLLVESEEGFTMDDDELELIIDILDSLLVFSDLACCVPNLQVAGSLLRSLLDGDRYAVEHKSYLDCLLTQLHTCNNLYKMQLAWLKKQDSSLEWIKLLIVTLVHVSYKLIYDDKLAKRIDILMCMQSLRDDNRAKLIEKSKILISSEYIFLSMLKFAVHLPNKIPLMTDEPIEKQSAKIRRLSFV